MLLLNHRSYIIKKIFSIFTVLMLVILPLCFVGCGNTNVVKDWTEVRSFSIDSSTQYSTIHFEYTREKCSLDEFNNAQNKIYSNYHDSYYYELTFTSNKQTSIEQAKEQLNNKVYYLQYTDYVYGGNCYKITYNGFYTDIIQIKMYNNNYIEYRHVYKDYGTVNIEHHSQIIGKLNDTYSFTYFE